MTLEFNKVYSFKVEHLFHPQCPKNYVNSMVKKIQTDARTSSPIITSFVSEQWFCGLEYVDEKYRDFVGGGYNIEKKMFGRYGAKFCPSYMVGSGRTIDPEKSLKICKDNELVYLLADANEFPNVYLTFVDGIELHKRHASCSIGYSNKWRQFYFNRDVV